MKIYMYVRSARKSMVEPCLSILVPCITLMANHNASSNSRFVVQRSLSRKELPAVPQRARLKAWTAQRGRRLVHGWWAWELIAASISILAMVTLIVVLVEADQHQQQSWAVGNTQLTLNTIVAAIGTVIRSSLLLAVAGALNQSAWNWFSSRTGAVENEGRPLEDLETFSEAAANSLNCLKLLWRTKGRYSLRSPSP